MMATAESGESDLIAGAFLDFLGGMTREITLVAAIGLMIGGIDDLLVDAIYFGRAAWRRIVRAPRLVLTDLPEAGSRIAVFVAAWDESAVIGAMLRTALDRWRSPALRIYVGVYPNDWSTIEAVAEVAEQDRRVRMVIGPRAGPTTKADCLNRVWRAMLADEEVEGIAFTAVALHDAEDVVHAGELAVFEHMLATHEAVQLPVLPLPQIYSRFVGGTYIDEFAESHAKQLVVRAAVGAGLPFAGVGCAMRRSMLSRIAEARGGVPFDAASLTEDYELGLTIADMGGRVAIARVAEVRGGQPVAVRAYFPDRIDTAVRQKARWMIGIALAGWDRVGWGRVHDLGEHWMRMRDRRVLLAAIVLLAAYVAPVLWGIVVLLDIADLYAPPPIDSAMQWLLIGNAALLAWRIVVRGLFVWRHYGWCQALLSAPRLLVCNLIALAAARRALGQYVALLRGGALHWDKTAHAFPKSLSRPPR